MKVHPVQTQASITTTNTLAGKCIFYTFLARDFIWHHKPARYPSIRTRVIVPARHAGYISWRNRFLEIDFMESWAP
jgi:hypothetical protein